MCKDKILGLGTLIKLSWKFTLEDNVKKMSKYVEFIKPIKSIKGSGIPELENRVKKPSYALWRHKTEFNQIF